MASIKLEKPAWHAYFDNVSKMLEGKCAEIEVDSLAIGSQIEAEWVPLFGLVYEPRSDTIEVLLEGIGHLIHKPKEVFIDQQVNQLTSLEVIDSDDLRHIVKLRDPLLLSAH